MLPAHILEEHNFIHSHALRKEFNSSACSVNADAGQDNVEREKPLNVLFLCSLLKSMLKDIGVTSGNEAAYFVLTWFVKGMDCSVVIWRGTLSLCFL